jgi:hypothetical protein
MKFEDYVRQHQRGLKYGAHNAPAHARLLRDILERPKEIGLPILTQFYVQIPFYTHVKEICSLNDLPRNVSVIKAELDLIAIDNERIVLIEAKYSEKRRELGRLERIREMREQLLRGREVVKEQFAVDSEILGVFREGKPDKKGFEVYNEQQLKFVARQSPIPLN